MTQTIQCARCGWQNESTAIMCGGCGQMLRAAPPAVAPTSVAPAPWQPEGRARPASAESDLPTLYDAPTQRAHPAHPARPSAGPSARAQQPTVWPGAQAGVVPRRKPGRRWRRVLLALVLALALLASIAAGAWGLAIRPAAHQQVDGTVASALDSAVARVPTIPALALQFGQTSATISDADVNALVQQQLQQSSGLDSLAVAFQPGAVLVTYSAYGRSGTVRSTLVVRGGSLQAANTQVTGILGWVETGDELQATVNRSLAQLKARTPYGFQSVDVESGKLTVALKTS
jgi:hypothetical protein